MIECTEMTIGKILLFLSIAEILSVFFKPPNPKIFLNLNIFIDQIIIYIIVWKCIFSDVWILNLCVLTSNIDVSFKFGLCSA